MKDAKKPMKRKRRLYLGAFCRLVIGCLICGKAFTGGAGITSPEPGTALESSTVAFSWTSGAGRYLLHVGTTGVGSQNIYNSGLLDNATTSLVVTSVPTDQVVYVRLWSERGVGTSSYVVADYRYNVDSDKDGILDEIDPNPGMTDPMRTFKGLTICWRFSVRGGLRVSSRHRCLATPSQG